MLTKDAFNNKIAAYLQAGRSTHRTGSNAQCMCLRWYLCINFADSFMQICMIIKSKYVNICLRVYRSFRAKLNKESEIAIDVGNNMRKYYAISGKCANDNSNKLYNYD